MIRDIWPALVICGVIAVIATVACAEDSGILMVHRHTTSTAEGRLEITKTGIAWHEQDAPRGGNEAHSFSAACGDLKGAELTRDLKVKVSLPSGNYILYPLPGYSGALVLDQIVITCERGEPFLSSSEKRWASGSAPLDADGPPNVVSFDIGKIIIGKPKSAGYFKPSGVAFVSQTGLRYEQFADHPQDGNFSLPCSSLSNITISIQGALDIHTANQTYRMVLGPFMPPASLKQAIADMCSRRSQD